MATKHSIYSVHPSLKMEQESENKIKERTGKTLDQWIRILKKSGPADRAERIEWLKTEHDFGTNYAGWIVRRADEPALIDTYDPEALVSEMYKNKQSLKAIYDRLLQIGLELGPDVKICPCKTMVPFYRKHVFAEIKPSTKTRIDFGLALKDTKPVGKLISTGGFEKKDRITHRFALTSVDEINAELQKWLEKAYSMDA